jgi:hypothetical protein
VDWAVYPADSWGSGEDRFQGIQEDDVVDCAIIWEEAGASRGGEGRLQPSEG